MKEFLIEYKELIVSILGVILTIILMIIKKRPATVDDFAEAVDSVFEFIPEAVKAVEKPGCGKAKKAKVMKYGLSLVERYLGRSLTEKEASIVSSRVDKFIESVLEAPTKSNSLKFGEFIREATQDVEGGKE